jgi:hypothetical protein
MASLAAFDLVKSGAIKTSSISPVLITYGQPRTGNYAFANELVKSIPVVLRFANIYDIIPIFPLCVKTIPMIGTCKNEFRKKDLDPKLNEYVPEPYSYLFYKFYPWHFRGLLTIQNDNESILPQCTDKSEAERECNLPTLDHLLKYHCEYFGFSITDFPNPEVMPYIRIYPEEELIIKS